ncbi:MAG: hypothetical protein KBS54_03935 [Synergistaceae bacterium]|nr:hypothetical protein [Candidatus Equadaptatus faecalis]
MNKTAALPASQPARSLLLRRAPVPFLLSLNSKLIQTLIFKTNADSSAGIKVADLTVCQTAAYFLLS